MGVNYIAVVLLTVVATLIGALWYSPVLFGTPWMRLMGISKKDLKKSKKDGMAKSYIVNFLATFLLVVMLAYFVNALDAKTFALGLQLGFFVWLGFVATIMLNTVIWEKKPLDLYFINVFYHLVTLVIIGGLLAVWN